MPFSPTAARVSDAEDAQPASLSELIESKFKTFSMLASYTKQNAPDKADARHQADEGEAARKSIGAAPGQRKDAASSNEGENLRASDLSASTPYPRED